MTEKKKILFISPARKRSPNEDFLFKMAFLNLPYLAAVTPEHYEIKIVDEEHESVDFGENPWLVAITAQTPIAPRAYEIAKQFRKKGIPTVMGGVHASYMTEEALEYADSVVVGEGEFIWPEVLSDLENNDLKQVYHSEVTHSLKGLPCPRRDTLNPRYYIPWTMIETTRGCPHKCDFCGVSEFFGHSYRKRPLDEVISELKAAYGSGMRHAINRFLAKTGLDLPFFLERRLIYFIDSNFAADRQYTWELMGALEELHVRWWAHTTVDIAKDKNFLEKMNRSGCIAVNIGFESLSQENLRAMHKAFAGNFDYSLATKRIHEHGMGIMGTFVVGFDDEDTSIFNDIYKFVLINKLDWALVFVRTPYPGTALYREMEKQNRIIERKWEKYDTLNCVFAPASMTVEEIQRGIKDTWKRIFSLRSIYRRILKPPWIHPMFYLAMNLQFYRMVRKW